MKSLLLSSAAAFGALNIGFATESGGSGGGGAKPLFGKAPTPAAAPADTAADTTEVATEESPVKVEVRTTQVEKPETVDGKPPETGPVESDAAKVQEQKDFVNESGTTEAFGKHGRLDENDPLTTESQIDALEKGAQEQSKRGEANAAVESAVVAARAGEADAGDDSVQFSSHPIARFRVGEFQFEAGQLTLDAKKAEEFRQLMATMPIREQTLVREINRQAGERAARSILESRMSRGVDTAGFGPKGSESGDHRA